MMLLPVSIRFVGTCVYTLHRHINQTRNQTAWCTYIVLPARDQDAEQSGDNGSHSGVVLSLDDCIRARASGDRPTARDTCERVQYNTNRDSLSQVGLTSSCQRSMLVLQCNGPLPIQRRPELQNLCLILLLTIVHRCGPEAQKPERISASSRAKDTPIIRTSSSA